MKEYKKYIYFIFTIVLGLVIISCEGLKSRIIDFDDLKVGYAIKNGALDDKGQVQLGYEGLERGKNQFGINIKVLEGDVNRKEEFQKDFKKLAEKNDLVIVIGNEFKSSINEVANNYRDKKFAVIGEGMTESNIQDITFRYEEGGFLVGVLAGKETKNNKVAFIGEENQSTDRLLAGYMAGVREVNKEASDYLLDQRNIRYVESTDTSKIIEEANSLYNQGVDIIFTNLGEGASNIFKIASELNKKAVGMGMDCKKMYPEYKGNILSSLIIRTDDVVYDIIKEVEEGNFKSGTKNSKILGVKENIIELLEDNDEDITEETLNILMNYKEDIANNEIRIPKTREEALEYKNN